MIGPKKLRTIRQELQRALAATGDDPIRWLEERMTVPGRQGSVPSGESEILRSLRRILEAPQGTGRQRQRSRTPRTGARDR
jgi:hypothetical protein